MHLTGSSITVMLTLNLVTIFFRLSSYVAHLFKAIFTVVYGVRQRGPSKAGVCFSSSICRDSAYLYNFGSNLNVPWMCCHKNAARGGGFCRSLQTWEFLLGSGPWTGVLGCKGICCKNPLTKIRWPLWVSNLWLYVWRKRLIHLFCFSGLKQLHLGQSNKRTITWQPVIFPLSSHCGEV